MLYKLIASILLRKPGGIRAVKFKGQDYTIHIEPLNLFDFFQKIAKEAGILGPDGELLSGKPL